MSKVCTACYSDQCDYGFIDLEYDELLCECCVYAMDEADLPEVLL